MHILNWEKDHERCPLSWTEWKINFPISAIFMVWVMVDFVYNLPVCHLNFQCHLFSSVLPTKKICCRSEVVQNLTNWLKKNHPKRWTMLLKQIFFCDLLFMTLWDKLDFVLNICSALVWDLDEFRIYIMLGGSAPRLWKLLDWITLTKWLSGIISSCF